MINIPDFTYLNGELANDGTILFYSMPKKNIHQLPDWFVCHEAGSIAAFAALLKKKWNQPIDPDFLNNYFNSRYTN